MKITLVFTVGSADSGNVAEFLEALNIIGVTV